MKKPKNIDKTKIRKLLSEETKQKMSESHKGLNHSEETKIKIGLNSGWRQLKSVKDL